MAKKSRFKMLKLEKTSDGRTNYGLFENANGVWRQIVCDNRNEIISRLQALRAEENDAPAAAENTAARVDVYYSTEKGWIAEAVKDGQVVKWGGGFGSAQHAVQWAHNLAPRAFIYRKGGGLPKVIDL